MNRNKLQDHEISTCFPPFLLKVGNNYQIFKAFVHNYARLYFRRIINEENNPPKTNKTTRKR